MNSWLIYAVFSAIFAALVWVFAKIGLGKIDSVLANAIRTVVLLPVLWAIVFATGKHKHIENIDRKALVFLALSALATGASWLCGFRAMSDDRASAASVQAIDKLSLVITFAIGVAILGEVFTWKAALGVALIAAGCVIMAL